MKKIFIFLIIICVCSIYKNTAYSHPYLYPVLPGDDLWNKTMNYDDRVRLCNIPDSILLNMSTGDLIETVFNFPYIQNLLLYDNFIKGFEYNQSLFNGLNELMERNNSPQLLFEIYSRENTNSYAKDILLEGMLSLPSITRNLDSSQKSILLSICLNKLSNRMRTESFLSGKSLILSSFLMIRLLSYLDKDLYNSIIDYNEDIKKFIETSDYPNKNTINKIIYEIIKYKG
jgi:hypothetical protein